jgi:hypothetical protein
MPLFNIGDNNVCFAAEGEAGFGVETYEEVLLGLFWGVEEEVGGGGGEVGQAEEGDLQGAEFYCVFELGLTFFTGVSYLCEP